ncbi:FUSC family protein [Flavobacteriaceae bacterium XHP0103]|uniref:FUSC family protein n=1 Tax=Marixanthotalea marina TaxID=2844359 RepID=UPI002989E2CC|nr:FUSC family protein [Marixanthotalea marina]MBU3821550.1 FUSC family protein [Marixanthotalea marina]
MKQVFIILGLTAAIIATVFAILPISNLAIFPAIAAFIFGLIAFYLSKKTGSVKKIIQFTFLLTIVSLSVSIYKAIFIKAEVANTEELIQKEDESKQEAIKELEELDLEDITLE